jgi:CHAT domain-containing protein
MESGEVFNGIDGSTGRYLTPAGRDQIEQVQKPPLDSAGLREYQWWVERYGLDDPNRAAVQQVDPKDLGQAGWAVLFGPRVGEEVKDALGPLLRHRASQAGPLYRKLDFKPGQTKQEFLLRNQAGPGPANPQKLPYYVLLVGDPNEIPYRFQYELDVQYAVGRIHFQETDDYRRYAESVVAAETSPPRPKELAFFGVRNPDDPATLRTSSELIEPLYRALEALRVEDAWSLRLDLAEQATKDRLAALLGGSETPALLFTACHGMAFPEAPALQVRHQGALLCQNWPGPQKWQQAIPETFYFSADDVPAGADLRGLITFHYACYSAGTPDFSDFNHPTLGGRSQIAALPFLAPLAQRLLSHANGGALAVLGHIDRAWTTSFSWKTPGQTPLDPTEAAELAKAEQIEVFESVLRRLLEGHPVGSAMEYVNQRHAELSVELSGLWEDREYQLSLSKEHFSRMWRANNDARNFIVVGDPAVRLGGAPWPTKEAKTPLREQVMWRESEQQSGASSDRMAEGNVGETPAAILELLMTTTGRPQIYQVAASSASQGHAVNLVSLAYLSEELKDIPALRDRPTNADELRALGTRLFETLLAGDIRFLYERLLGGLSEKARGLRLLLRMDAPELTVLPWEVLFDPGRKLFLATDPRCSLSRSLTLLEPIRSLASSGPLRILMVQPVSSGLYSRAEEDVLDQVRGALGDSSIQVVKLSQRRATPEALRSALHSDPHIVHFAGHAAFRENEAVIFLDRQDGTPWPMLAPAFAHLFLERPSVRLVVLNACEGASRSAHQVLAGLAPWLLRRGLPAVVAMQWPITNSEAGLFATELYRHLARRGDGDLEVAMARARGALFQEKPYSPAFANAVLYLRAPDSSLFLSADAVESSEQRGSHSSPHPLQPSVQSSYNTTGGPGSLNIGGSVQQISGGIHFHGPKRHDPE